MGLSQGNFDAEGEYCLYNMGPIAITRKLMFTYTVKVQ